MLMGSSIIAMRVSGKQKLVLQQVGLKVDLAKNVWPLRSLIGGNWRRGVAELVEGGGMACPPGKV